ncbi:DUF488 domain-containing protein [Apirhabdus apintestini]|nr:DUF488 domain-containing protein [Enterobacteriaceae bacterium CA-0114]
MIQCKRVYDPANKNDGYRVLIDRLWPRGIRKEALVFDEWCKAVAPSAELRKALHSETIDFAAFQHQYQEELIKAPQEVARLAQKAQEGTLTLLYAARDTTQNHALVLADYLRQAL